MNAKIPRTLPADPMWSEFTPLRDLAAAVIRRALMDLTDPRDCECCGRGRSTCAKEFLSNNTEMLELWAKWTPVTNLAECAEWAKGKDFDAIERFINQRKLPNLKQKAA